MQKLQKKTDTVGLALVLANKDGAPMVEGWHFLGVRHALMKFEAVLSAEYARNPVFAAPKRGVFDTDDLVNMAREMNPAALSPAISDRALGDLDSAGRCLAFGLFTASGFHACRAVEAVMENYYRRFCGSTETLRSWHDYISELEKVIAAGGPPTPEASTVSHLNTMRKYNRNEIAHPRVLLGRITRRFDASPGRKPEQVELIEHMV